jgi:hypothetical protein
MIANAQLAAKYFIAPKYLFICVCPVENIEELIAPPGRLRMRTICAAITRGIRLIFPPTTTFFLLPRTYHGMAARNFWRAGDRTMNATRESGGVLQTGIFGAAHD